MLRCSDDSIRLSQLPTDNSTDLICPECGYDLRAIDSGRCPECGTPFDRATATRSTIPWANRQTIGRVRGYWRTAWIATFRPRMLGKECARPVALRDAERFRWMTVLILLITWVPIAEWIIRANGGREALIHDAFFSNPWSPLPSMADLALPWSAAMLLWGTVP